MRKVRAVTMAETLVGLSLTSLLFLISMSLFSGAIGSFRKSDTRLELSQKLSLSLRKMNQELRSAVSVTISGDAKTVTYQLPKLNPTTDSVTGEREYVYPVQGDNVNRSFYVSGTNLYFNDGSSGAKIIAKNIATTDPDPQSSYYNLAYPVFSFSSVASTKGMTVMLIAKKVVRTTEYARESTSIRFRNVP